MKLHTLKPAAGSRKTARRVGRGQGSGMGGTSTRGHKGAQSRAGYSRKGGFEGGQMPLYRRIPKFGFKNRNRVEYIPLNLDMIQSLVDANPGTVEITHQFLADKGYIAKADEQIKVLGRGELTAKVTVKLNKFSATAKAAIEKAGGVATEI